jgi:hypothetical protein
VGLVIVVSSLVLVPPLRATILFDDTFSDGNIATNTGGVGTGFTTQNTADSTFSVTESGGNGILFITGNNGNASLNQINSTSLVNPLTAGAWMKFSFGSVSFTGAGGQLPRPYFGIKQSSAGIPFVSSTTFFVVYVNNNNNVDIWGSNSGGTAVLLGSINPDNLTLTGSWQGAVALTATGWTVSVTDSDSTASQSGVWAGTGVSPSTFLTSNQGYVFVGDQKNPGNSSITTNVDRVLVANATTTISPGSIALPTIITGATSPSLNITATETVGVAGNYNIGSPSGSFLVSGSGNATAPIGASAAVNHAVTYSNTGIAGAVSGSIVFQNGTSGSVTGSPVTVSLGGTILDHAKGEFRSQGLGDAISQALSNSDQDLTIDFGTVTAGSGILDSFFDIFAEITTASFTADLELLSITGSDPALTILGPGSFSGLVAGDSGGSGDYTVQLDTSTPGTVSAVYTFNMFDDQAFNGLGAVGQTLTLTVTAEIQSEVQSIPEPGTFALAVLGLAGLSTLAWRRRHRG